MFILLLKYYLVNNFFLTSNFFTYNLQHVSCRSYLNFTCTLIARNLIKGKELLDPISIDNIDIMKDWIAEEENLFDTDDFDMDWETVEEPLITSSKIVIMKKLFLMKMMKSLFHQIKVSGNELVFFRNLKMLMNDLIV